MEQFKENKYVFVPAEKAGAPTLLLLHGTGGDENDLIPLGADLTGGKWNLLGLRGNVLEQGMPRFFRRLGMGIFDEADLAFRTDELVKSLQDIAERESFDVEKLVAVGYSNGANIAGGLLARHPGFLKGAVLWRPMRPFREDSAFGSVDSKVPVLITYGNSDTLERPERVVAYGDWLSELGYEVETEGLPTGHNLVQQDITLAEAFVGRIEL